MKENFHVPFGRPRGLVTASLSLMICCISTADVLEIFYYLNPIISNKYTTLTTQSESVYLV